MLIAFGVWPGCAAAQGIPAGHRSAVSSDPLTKQRVFDLLTSSHWCDPQASAESTPPENKCWTFRTNGTYQWRVLSDYAPAPRASGHFNIEGQPGAWVLALDSGDRHRLSFRADGSTVIDREPFVAHGPSGQEPRLVDSIPPITIPQVVLSVMETLTQSTWRRTEKDVPNRRPTSIRFLNDWTYVTSYRDGACENRGTWYATKKEIRGYAPTNPCDAAEGGYGENLRGVVLEKGDLLLNGNTFVLR